MKVPLTRWLVSAVVLAAIFAVALPNASYGSNPQLVLLDAEPPEPELEASLDFGLGILLVGDSNGPEPECFPY